MAKRRVRRALVRRDVKRKAATSRKRERRAVVTKRARESVRRKRELSPLEKNVLWCFALGSKNPSDVANALNLDLERANEEVSRLLEYGYLMERGGFSRRLELTAQGYEVLGSPGIKLDAYVTTENLRSGAHAKLVVTARNSGNAPITDAVIKIVAPKFLTISRYGSEYMEDEDTSAVQFQLAHLNPGETQTIEFNVHGALTRGTVASKYKIYVHALTGGSVTDRKELGITLLE